MAKNWIILDDGTAQGVAVNLDFGADVIYGGNIAGATADQLLTVFFSQGVQNQKGNPSYKVCKFTSANLAIAFYNRVVRTLTELGYLGADLRKVEVKLTSATPDTAVHDAGTAIAVVGDNFTQSGKITVNGVDQVTTYVSAQGLTFVAAGAGAGGPYDVEYTEPNGKAARLASGLSLT